MGTAIARAQATVLLCLLGLVACSRPPVAEDSAPAAAGDEGSTSSEQVSGTAAPGAEAVAGAATRACMITGAFQVMGQTIRSRDCMQTTREVPEQDLVRACEGLAQTSAQMGGKAGDIAYLDACPLPAQGSCRNLAGKGIDGFYYERSADDLVSLPQSCALSGGTWVPAG